MGRPAKPIEQRRREGNRSKDALPPPVVVGGRTAAKPRPGMSPDVRKAFRLIAGHLESAGILDAADAPAVEAAAVMLVRARTAAADIAERGQLVEIRRVGADRSVLDRLEANPSLTIERAAWAEFRQLADRLGIGPSARARLAGMAVQGRSAEQQIDGLAEIRELRVVGGGDRQRPEVKRSPVPRPPPVRATNTPREVTDGEP